MSNLFSCMLIPQKELGERDGQGLVSANKANLITGKRISVVLEVHIGIGLMWLCFLNTKEVTAILVPFNLFCYFWVGEVRVLVEWVECHLHFWPFNVDSVLLVY